VHPKRGGLTPDDLRLGAAARLAAIATLYGEDDPAKAAAALAVHGELPFATWQLRYRDDASPITLVRRTLAAEVRAEVAPLEATLAGSDEDGADDVLALLGDAAELVTLSLAPGDVEGIGWAVALAVAATIAERGGGLVQADGDGYLEPEGRSLVHVLDGD